jgi:primosomal protein N' (replication factor Y)
MANRYFSNLSECIKLMLPPGTTTKNMQNRVKEKNMSFVCLQKDEEQIYFDIETKKIKSEKHIRVLKFLIENGEIPIQDLELITEVSRAVLKTIEKNGYIKIFEKQVNRNPLINKKIAKTSKLELTEEQQSAYEKIEEAIDDKFNSEFLIFGVTGSRKN